jgi:CPA2 family monovalent cation:H+ antiporter-2
MGLALGLIPDEAFQLVVAASLVSITLNPVAFRLADAIESRLRSRPGLIARLERRPPELAALPTAEDGPLGGHAILCGYGRVGRMIAAALERRGFRYVVLSSDRREVERLRAREIPALFGDAANPELLQIAGVDRARVVIVALSDAHAARLIVDRTRNIAPRVSLVVRTHSGPEALHLRTLGRTVQAVHAEREVAVQMTRFSLRRFGLSSQEVEAIAQGLRGGGGGEPGAGDTGAGGTGGASTPGLVGRLRSRLAREAPDTPTTDAPRRIADAADVRAVESRQG